VLKKASLLVSLIVVCILVVPFVHSTDEYSINSISIQIFTDGVTQIETQIDVDPTLSRVNFTAQGQLISDLTVTNQDDNLLESRVINGTIVVDTLGSQTIDVIYTTSDLTSKNGSTWLFRTTLPVEGNVLFPSGATIASMNPIPSGISVIGDLTTLTMPKGPISIGYIIGVVGTKEHALALLKEAQTSVESVSSSGIIVTEAENLLSQAEAAYSASSYAETENLAKQANDKALEIQNLAEEAENMIVQAQNALDAASSSSRTSNFAAKDKLDSANAAYSQGNYTLATSDALEALRLAQESKSGTPWSMILLAGLIVVVASAGIIYRNKRQRKIETPIKKEVSRVKLDIQRLFDENPTLRLDEKEVLRYINDSKEGVFITELRERFDLPKSSAWRMMRRLEEMNLVSTEEVGRETFVRIDDRYTKNN
jgi:uncharacterized membrane protein